MRARTTHAKQSSINPIHPFPLPVLSGNFSHLQNHNGSHWLHPVQPKPNGNGTPDLQHNIRGESGSIDPLPKHVTEAPCWVHTLDASSKVSIASFPLAIGPVSEHALAHHIHHHVMLVALFHFRFACRRSLFITPSRTTSKLSSVVRVCFSTGMGRGRTPPQFPFFCFDHLETSIF